MIKKALLILLLPTVVFIYLESCNKPCNHKQSIQVAGMESSQYQDISVGQKAIKLSLSYERIFASNYQFNLTNKAMATSKPTVDPCFNEFLTPINSISVISENDFSTSYPAGTELNSLFRLIDNERARLNFFKYTYTLYERNHEDFDQLLYELKFYNDSIPTLDSIHNLTITVSCENGDFFSDKLNNVKLNN